MVKCSECGYLTLRTARGRDLVEAQSNYREDAANVPDLERRGFNFYEDAPLCFARESQFTPLTSPERLLDAFESERECESYTKWQQGFTPKEHREMIDRERMLKYQTDREDSDRKFRQGLEDNATQRHQEQMKALRKGLKWEIIVIGLAVTALLFIAQIGSAFIERGSIFGSGPANQPAQVEIHVVRP